MRAQFMTVIRQGEKLGALFAGVVLSEDEGLKISSTIVDASLMLEKKQEGQRGFLEYFNSRGIGQAEIGYALLGVQMALEEMKQGKITLERIPTVEEFMGVLASSKPEALPS